MNIRVYSSNTTDNLIGEVYKSPSDAGWVWECYIPGKQRRLDCYTDVEFAVEALLDWLQD